MPTCSSAEVAAAAGISKRTLLRWLQDGKVREPRRVTFAGQESRVWSERDLQRVKKYKADNYRKGRGRKKPKT